MRWRVGLGLRETGQARLVFAAAEMPSGQACSTCQPSEAAPGAGLTAGLHVLNALHGEQQRPQQRLPGILAKPAQLLGIAGTR